MQTEQRIFHGVQGMFAKAKPAPAGDGYLELAADRDRAAEKHEKASKAARDEADKHEKAGKAARDEAARFRAAQNGDFGDSADDATPEEMAIAGACGVSRERYIAQRRKPLSSLHTASGPAPADSHAAPAGMRIVFPAQRAAR